MSSKGEWHKPPSATKAGAAYLRQVSARKASQAPSLRAELSKTKDADRAQLSRYGAADCTDGNVVSCPR